MLGVLHFFFHVKLGLIDIMLDIVLGAFQLLFVALSFNLGLFSLLTGLIFLLIYFLLGFNNSFVVGVLGIVFGLRDSFSDFLAGCLDLFTLAHVVYKEATP